MPRNVVGRQQMSRSPDLWRERDFDQELVELEEQSDAERAGSPPDVEVQSRLHANFGNGLVQSALAGVGGGLGELVLADMALSTVGLATGGSEFLGGSNRAVQAAMRRMGSRARPAGGLSASARLERALSRGGRPLPEHLRERLERAFGVSLDSVRIHDDAVAADAARAVQARAMTLGTDILFGRGEFRPGTPAGDELIAHEVTHVVQHLEGREGRASAVEDDVPVTLPSDAVEIEATEAGRDFAAGRLEAEAPLEAAADQEGTQAVGLAGTTEEAPSTAGPAAAPSASEAVAARETGRGTNTCESGSSSTEDQDCEGDDQSAQISRREPTEAELAALDQAEEGQKQGDEEAGEAEDAPSDEDLVCEEPATGQSVAPSASVDPTTPGGGPTMSVPQVQDTQPPAPQEQPPESGSAIEQYMIEHGPQENDESQAAEELASSAWNLFTDAFGPLVAYDRERGGFAFDNLWGVGAGIERIFDTATQDRGDSALATASTVIDTLRTTAETVGAVSGAIASTCAILGLIGLIPPLAPVGAALESIAGIAGQIALWSGIVATLLAEIGTVVNAILLVEAVKDGASNVAELYQVFEEDVGAFMADGIGVALFFLGRKIETEQMEGAGRAMSHYADTVAATDGRIARGTAYQGLKAMGRAEGNLLSQKGTTREVLTSMLRTDIATGVGEKFVVKSGERMLHHVIDLGIEGNEDEGGHSGGKQSGGGHLASLAHQVSGGSTSPASGLERRLTSSIPQSNQHDGAAELPTPEHSPAELDQIAARRTEIAQARDHVAEVRSQGEAAVSGGESLLEAASSHEENACRLDEQVQRHADGLSEQAEQAQEGQDLASQGQDHTGDMSSRTDTLHSKAQDKQREADQTQMPQKPEHESFWDRIASWFEEKVWGTVEAALGKVKEFISEIVLQVVAYLMGVDDIDAKLAEAGVAMEQAGEQTEQSQEQNEQASEHVSEMHSQADQAQQDAQTAISEGNDAVCQAESTDAELQAEDEALQSEAEEVQDYCAEYAEEYGPMLDGSDQDDEPAVDPRVIDAYEAEAERVIAWIDDQEKAISDLVSRAREAFRAEAENAGEDVDAVLQSDYLPLEDALSDFLERQDGRRSALAGVTDAFPRMSRPGVDVQASLRALAREIQQLANDAEADCRTFRDGLKDYLDQAGSW